LADVLRAAGLKVAETQGWKTRGRGTFGTAEFVMVHHTANRNYKKNYPSLGVVTNGRSDLRGPLCNLGLGRDGTWYVVAAGIASHAGTGNYRGLTNGNSTSIGIEFENDGTGEVWAPVMLDSLVHGIAALLKHMGKSSERCCGHKEYRLPPGYKIDPFSSDHPGGRDTFDMNVFRLRIATVMNGNTAPTVVPPTDGKDRPTLWRGMPKRSFEVQAAIKTLQTRLGLDVDGDYGPKTEAAVRQFQRDHPPLVPDGRVGPKSWSVLEIM